MEIRSKLATATSWTSSTVRTYANILVLAIFVSAGAPDRPALNLVTCGGKYDEAAGGYQSNVVVFTTLLWATAGEVSES